MLSLNKILFSSLFILLIAVSAYSINLALELKQSCQSKVEAGQVCTSCIKVEDLIKELGLEVNP